MMSVILLSSACNVLLVPVLRACARQGVAVEAVMIDGELSARDQENVRARLLPGYEIPALTGLDLPDVPFYFVGDHRSAATVARIARMGSRYIANAGTPRILKGGILSVKRGVLNAHPGILPKYRGCTCPEWAIYNGDPVGVTVHFMDEGIDTGPVVMTAAMPVDGVGSYEHLRTALVDFTAEALAQGIVRCCREGLEPGAMPAQTGGAYFKPIDDEKMAVVREKCRSLNLKP